MKTLTFIQPYAELIACAKKRVENRTWYLHHRGPLAIHAGKALRYAGTSIYEIAESYDLPRDRLTLGAVVAIADAVDCVKLIELDSGAAMREGRDFDVPAWANKRYPWLADHEHANGPYCFVLANVRRLAKPIVMKGQQGLFDIDDAAIAVAGLQAEVLRV